MSNLRKYLMFAFIPAWILQIIASSSSGSDSVGNQMVFGNALALCMLTPTLGAFLAKADICGMGWKPKLIRNIPHFLFAWLMPTVFVLAGAFLYFGLFPDDLNMEAGFRRCLTDEGYADFMRNGRSYIGFVVDDIVDSLTSFSIIMAVILALGEEIGWRGFLYPELKSRFGRVRGVLLGGVIHGVWHFPVMLLAGYEYAKEYIGAPVLGLLAFCIYTVSIGIIADRLYEKSQSIWLPALYHAMINGSFSPSLFKGEAYPERRIFGPSDIGLISVIPTLLFAAGTLYFAYKREQNAYADS